MMKHAFASVLLLIVSAPALAGNYATCIIDKMGDVQNDVAAHAVINICIEKYPGGMAIIEQGAGRGIFGFDSGAECIVKKSAKTSNIKASMLIGHACRKLYEPPKFSPDDPLNILSK